MLDLSNLLNFAPANTDVSEEQPATGQPGDAITDREPAAPNTPDHAALVSDIIGFLNNPPIQPEQASQANAEYMAQLARDAAEKVAARRNPNADYSWGEKTLRALADIAQMWGTHRLGTSQTDRGEQAFQANRQNDQLSGYAQAELSDAMAKLTLKEKQAFRDRLAKEKATFDKLSNIIQRSPYYDDLAKQNPDVQKQLEGAVLAMAHNPDNRDIWNAAEKTLLHIDQQISDLELKDKRAAKKNPEDVEKEKTLNRIFSLETSIAQLALQPGAPREGMLSSLRNAYLVTGPDGKQKIRRPDKSYSIEDLRSIENLLSQARMGTAITAGDFKAAQNAAELDRRVGEDKTFLVQREMDKREIPADAPELEVYRRSNNSSADQNYFVSTVQAKYPKRETVKEINDAKKALEDLQKGIPIHINSIKTFPETLEQPQAEATIRNVIEAIYHLVSANLKSLDTETDPASKRLLMEYKRSVLQSARQQIEKAIETKPHLKKAYDKVKADILK